MIVVIVKMRATSPQAVQEICRVHSQSFEWYQEPGWLGGRCVANTSDPLQVLGIEEWGSRPAFDAWYNSPSRVRYDRQCAPLKVGDIQVEVYEEV
jgi:quinol monooxygenase YgiN